MLFSSSVASLHRKNSEKKECAISLTKYLREIADSTIRDVATNKP